MALKEGMTARVRPIVIEGTITELEFDRKTGEKRLLFTWEGEDGESHSRWFSEDELEAVDAVNSKPVKDRSAVAQ